MKNGKKIQKFLKKKSKKSKKSKIHNKKILKKVKNWKIKRVPPMKKNYAKGYPLWSPEFKIQKHRGDPLP